MAKFLHCADIHLDTRFYSMDSDRNAQRRKELRNVISRIVDLALDQQVDVVFMSGDLFDEQNATMDSIEIMIDEMNRAESIRFFISPGNHDPFTARSHYGLTVFPKNVHVFSQPKIDKVVIPELKLNVYGAGFVSEHCANLLNGFKAEAGDYSSVMVIHGDVNTQSSYNSMTMEDISSSGLDYLALGHVHKSSISKAGATVFAYPGVPEGRAFDECGEKGVLLGEVSKGRTKVEFHNIAERQYFALEIDVTDADNQESIINKVKNAFTPNAKKHLYKIVLTGIPAIEVDCSAIAEKLMDYCYFVKVKDITTIAAPNIIAPDSLKGIFLSLIEERMEAAEDPELKRELALARNYGLSVLERREISI